MCPRQKTRTFVTKTGKSTKVLCIIMVYLVSCCVTVSNFGWAKQTEKGTDLRSISEVRPSIVY